MNQAEFLNLNTFPARLTSEEAAWLIGWCLLLEYGLANSAVAAGWGGYLKQFLGVEFPPYLMYATGQTIPHTKDIAILNLPAVIAIAIPTVLLLFGIRESARFNNGMVLAKIIVLTMFVALCAPTVNVHYLEPFMPFGWHGVMSGAAVRALLASLSVRGGQRRGFSGFPVRRIAAAPADRRHRGLPRAARFQGLCSACR